ncbi:hypothetical protein [Kutzneria sp. NPDC052558]|uniref:hypothetical protein n=1 Tax=Kutzneria sp. NPDC052558 TaxID=3364121 RepID=UPI0037CC23D0
MHALAATAVAAALVAAPAAAPALHPARPSQQSLEGRKGAGALPVAVTQRYLLRLPGSPNPGADVHASYSGREDPPPTGDPAPPSPGMIVLLAVLALVGAGALMVAPRWLRAAEPPSGASAERRCATPSG